MSEEEEEEELFNRDMPWQQQIQRTFRKTKKKLPNKEEEETFFKKFLAEVSKEE